MEPLSEKEGKMIRQSAFLSLLLPIILLSACTPATMAVNPRLADTADVFSLQGHGTRWANSDIQMGPWLVTSVKEGWSFSWGLNIDDVDFLTESRPLRFRLLDRQDRAVDVECRTRINELTALGVDIDVSDIAHPRMRCGIESGSDRHRLTMHRKGNGFAGELSGTPFTISSNHRLEGAAFSSGEPVGYTISNSREDVAAVETINDGRLWLDRELDPRERLLLASVSAALLFFQPEMLRPDDL
jgi:hypothetical protein